MPCFKHIVFISLLLIARGNVISQISQVRFVKKYTQAQGLSSYNISKITQDSKGFIWIATQHGLNRFDGKKFIQYNKNYAGEHKLCGADIKDIVEDKQRNLLWVLSSDCGINAINLSSGKVERTVEINSVTSNDWYVCIALANNKLWIGVSTGFIKVYNITEGKFENNIVIPNKEGRDKRVKAIYADVYGNVWAGVVSHGVVIINSENSKIIKTVPYSSFVNKAIKGDMIFKNFCAVNDHELYLSSNNGLRKIVFNSNYRINIVNTPSLALPALNNDNIQFICKSREGSVYIKSFSQLYKFSAGLASYKLIEEQGNSVEGNWVSSIQTIYSDITNNLWLGCEQGLGFIPSRILPFTSFYYSKTNSLKLEHVRSILPVSDQKILVGLNSGLAAVDNNSHDFTIEFKEHLFNYLFFDWKGNVVASRDDGLFVYNNGTMQRIDNYYPELKKFATYRVNSQLLIGDSIMILGTENQKGILVWNYKRKNVREISRQTGLLQSDIVNNIFRDDRENIWVLSDHNISILSKSFELVKTFSIAETQKKSFSLYFDMCKARGSYWVASYSNGILQLDSNYRFVKVVNSKTGLSNDGVYQVYNIGDSSLLVTTNNGLSFIELNKGSVRNFFESDGLHSGSFEEVCGLRKDGFIYAGGVKGFSIIDPRNFTTNTTAPIVIFNSADIKTRDSSYKVSLVSSGIVTIPSTVLQTNIHFSGLNYLDPEHTIFSYKIKELDNKWIPLETQNFVTLVPLSPGKYTLEVQAANEDGLKSQPVFITLHFMPKWHQTSAFKLALIFLVLLTIYVLYKRRINDLRKEQKIRSTLASDLHDDLGSTLNSVKVYADLAIIDEGKETHLQKVKQSTQQAISDLRDIIWVMDDKKGSIEHLVLRINRFALPYSEVHNILFETEVSSEAMEYNLNTEEKKNIYMILKEAINNSIKYAEAQQLKLNIFLRKGKPVFTIKDDGKGFDKQATSEGNGLQNMKTRAKSIRYHLKIASVSGTTIELQKL